MLGKLKQLMQSGGSKGPVPSGLCLWRDLDGLNQMADRLAQQAITVPDWQAWRESPQPRKTE